MRQTQGKCTRCRTRRVWTGKPLLKHAFCPECEERLAQTNYRLGWPVKTGAVAQ